MALSRTALEELGREELLAEARRAGARRPEVMTRVELVDEVLRITTPNPVERKKVRGWLGVARDLLASVVEQGLNLPDAAAMIRGDVRFEPLRAPQSPVATVTLAEIYGAQGHYERAFGILDEVLAKEPEHEIARRLRDRLASERGNRRTAERSLSEPSTLEVAPPTSTQEAVETVSFDAPVLDEEPPFEPPDDELVTLAPPKNGPAPVVHDTAAVVARTNGGAATVYFEVGDDVAGETPWVVRVLEVRPRPSGAERAVHDVFVTGSRGTATVHELEPGSVIRAAVGRTENGEFRALAVAAVVELGKNGSGAQIAWAPRKNVDYRGVAERGAQLLA